MDQIKLNLQFRINTFLKPLLYDSEKRYLYETKF